MADTTLSPDDRVAAVHNLERIRQIPPQTQGRHIIIDAANATLWMYDGDKPVDSMKVVVGKPKKQTPAYAGYIRSAYLNPYWNVPADMIRSIIAKNVLTQGMGYLKRQGYEVVSSYGSEGEPIDPLTIDWPAVQRGDLKIFVRQKPGPRNSMGTMKYEFPNPHGIYLHDTPEKGTLEAAGRQESAGCIRLEDAKRLGSWLMQGDIQKLGDAPEQRIELPQPVPMYITYLTAQVGDDGQIAFGPDPYSRDGVALAAAN
jgi:L,D-transpeptidase YcbB